jgi:hypothetical protein
MKGTIILMPEYEEERYKRPCLYMSVSLFVTRFRKVNYKSTIAIAQSSAVGEIDRHTVPFFREIGL